MTTNKLFRASLVAGFLLAAWTGCASERIDVGDRLPGPNPTPTFAPAEDAGDDGAPLALRMCATSECPAGRTTCPNNPFPCAIDLSSDSDNCGACGNHCPEVDFRGLGRTSCVDGVCQLTCLSGFADCNGLVDDSCETPIVDDVNNCGGCGIVCADICMDGICGCRGGTPDFCDQGCTNLDTDNWNCGSCGEVCPESTDPPPPPEWNAAHGCLGGKCNKLGCIPPWRDCNGDILHPSGDGCESDTSSDVANCGGCGQACAAGETCFNGVCECHCGSTCFQEMLNLDPQNCGACGHECPAADHASPVCHEGICETRCLPGWGDCDGRSANGCETNLADDPFNCGGCGVRCDGIEKQACVEGQCSVKECGGVE